MKVPNKRLIKQLQRKDDAYLIHLLETLCRLRHMTIVYDTYSKTGLFDLIPFINQTLQERREYLRRVPFKKTTFIT